MNSNSIYPDNQTSYKVIRPVDDLWLWWAAVAVGSYLLSHLLSLLSDNSLVIMGVGSVISFVVVIWVLYRYFGNFKWTEWLAVNIVGYIIAFVTAGVLLTIVSSIYRAIAKDQLPVFVIYALAAPILGLFTALARWRIFGPYAQGRGLGLWIIANIIALEPVAAMTLVGKQITDNAYVQLAGNAVATALGSLLVGYTLMRILQIYASPPKR